MSLIGIGFPLSALAPSQQWGIVLATSNERYRMPHPKHCSMVRLQAATPSGDCFGFDGSERRWLPQTGHSAASDRSNSQQSSQKTLGIELAYTNGAQFTVISSLNSLTSWSPTTNMALYSRISGLPGASSTRGRGQTP
jgi:hypothetical protein